MTRPQSLEAFTTDADAAAAHASQYKLLSTGRSRLHGVELHLMQVHPGYQPHGAGQWKWTDGYYAVGCQVGPRTHGKAFDRTVHGARRAGIYFNALSA